MKTLGAGEEPGQDQGWLLLSRPECPLCEEFFEALAAVFPHLAAQVVSADVDSREEWRRRYGYRIPVLLDADGTLICSGHFDAAAVAAALGGH